MSAKFKIAVAIAGALTFVAGVSLIVYFVFFSYDRVSCFDIGEDTIYFRSGANNGYVYEMGLEGENPKLLCKADADDIIFADGIVFFNNNDDNGYLYCIKNGTENLFINDKAENAVFYNGFLYYCNMSDEEALYKIRTDGSERVKLSNCKTADFVVTDDFVYYTNNDDNKYIYKVKTGNDNIKLNEVTSSYLCVDGDFIFYRNENDNSTIYKMKRNGTENVKFNDENSRNLFVLGEYIYFQTGTLQRIKKDSLYIASDKKSEKARAEQVLNAFCYNIRIVNDLIYFRNESDNDSICNIDPITLKMKKIYPNGGGNNG